MIPKQTVDAILYAAKIVDLVGVFFTLKRRGANYMACCPFHNEKTPSFYVSPAKGIYKCFGCGKAGSAASFIMEHESLSYVDALKWLAQKYHIEVVEKEETAEEIASRQHSESLYLINDYAAKFFADQLQTPEGRSLGYAYFRSRGLEDQTIAKFGLGWSPIGKNMLSKSAREAGYKEDYLVETGLSIRRDDGSVVDRFFERAMFPIHSVSGKVIAFGGRTLKSDKTVAKYVNSPESEVYKKSYSLYGIYHAKGEIIRKDSCLLVEGYLDVISMHQLGITNVVASSGTSLTEQQVKLIHKFTENVTIIYDGDAAGIHAALRGIGLVLKDGLNVKVVLLPDGHDPDSYSREHSLAEVNEFIDTHAQDFISFKTDLLLGEAGGDPLKKANLINDIADTIALIPDAVKRSVYVEASAEKFKIDSTILFKRIARTREAMLVEEKKRREREARLAEGLDPGPEEAQAVDDVDPNIAQAVADAQKSAEEKYLAAIERELLEFVLTKGQDELIIDEDSEFYEPELGCVAKYIDDNLAADDLEFANEPLRKTYEAYFALYEEGLEQQQITSRMMDDPDPEIAQITRELVIPKYDLTVSSYESSLTNETHHLAEFVPRAMAIYKLKFVELNIRAESAKLATADEPEEILKTIVELNRLKLFLNSKLGRRPSKN